MQDAADVVLMQEGIAGVATLLDLSVSVRRVIIFNFCWAFAYNFFALLIAIGVFQPLGFVLPPALAGLGEVFSVMPVLLASLLLKLYRKPALGEPLRSVAVDRYAELEEITL
jgi:cation transport ATPase